MAYLGDFLIYTAVSCSVLSLIGYFLVWRGNEQYRPVSRNFFRVATASVVGALAALMYLILTHDFSVAYVFSYSSSDLPLDYLISTLWAGQEGTFLLWVFYSGLLGLVMMRTAKRFEAGNMFILNLFLISILLILIKKSPFELLPMFRAEGSGLNPLLQNYWMVIHPPIMFAGFSGVVFPFCFAMTALIERKYQTWAEAARRWTLFAWSLLGISLIMGGYWAYETLGWGGFWAWDPVENSSLIPWLFLTTQIHALFIKRRRRGLMRFSLIAVCLSFWAVLYGTFLTRSGVLADFSVHSFVDLGINQFLVGGLLFFVGLGVFLLLFRWQDITPEPSYSNVASRSYLVTLGIVISFLAGVLVLLGTSAPLLTRITDSPSDVSQQYYFITMTPIAVALLLLLGLFPAFKWNSGISGKKLIASGVGALLTLLVMLITGQTSRIIYLLLFPCAIWAMTTNAIAFYRSWRAGQLIPGYISHVGLAVALVGATASAGFSVSEVVLLEQGRMVQVMSHDLKFTKIVDTPMGFDCHVEVSAEDYQFVAVLPHEFPSNAEGVMKKPHVENYLTRDIYISPQSFQPAEATESGTLEMFKGDSSSIDKYSITFSDFNIMNHGEDEMIVAAVIQVSYDGKSEEVTPALRVVEGSVSSESASFDGETGTVSIAGVNPEDGGVSLKFAGAFLPVSDIGRASIVIELSRKPLIILFWLGTIIMFSGGILSLVVRRRRFRSSRDKPGKTLKDSQTASPSITESV